MMVQQITTRHLQRLAYLYIRQSTLQQVIEHRESTARQYALQVRAITLGWPVDGRPDGEAGRACGGHDPG